MRGLIGSIANTGRRPWVRLPARQLGVGCSLARGGRGKPVLSREPGDMSTRQNGSAGASPSRLRRVLTISAEGAPVSLPLFLQRHEQLISGRVVVILIDQGVSVFGNEEEVPCEGGRDATDFRRVIGLAS